MDLKRIALCGMIALSLTFSNVAFGIDFDNNGNGATPGDWNDPLNWDGDVVPAGSAAATGDVAIGTTAFNNTTATLNAPPISSTIFDLRIGSSFGTGGGGNVGTLNHSAGTLASNWAFLGVDGDGVGGVNVGTYNLSGTAEHTASVFTLGIGGGIDPTIINNQGILNVSDTASLVVADGFNVGRGDSTLGEVTQTGGTVSAGSWFNVGDDGASQAVYNISGGSASAPQISVGQTAGSSGVFNLSGTASVSATDPAQGLRVGRGLIPDQQPSNFSEGLFSITGGGVSVSVTNLSVGGDETGEFAAVPTPTTTPAEGTLSFTSDATGISSIDVSGDVLLNDGSIAGFADLVVDLETDPVTGDVVLIDLDATGTVTGTFQGLAEGATVPNSGGRTITYTFGPDGNDIALIGGAVGLPGDGDGDGDVDGEDFLYFQRNDPSSIPIWRANFPTPLTGAVAAVPEPASVSLVALGLCLAALRRRV